MPYKILADCHSHSNCSFDGEAPMEAMCARAEALGLAYYALTDHCECDQYDGSPEFGGRKYYDVVRRAWRELEENRKRSVFCGILHFEPHLPENIALVKARPGVPLYDFPEEEQARLFAEQTAKYTAPLAVTYCNRCTAGISLGDGKAVHLMELAMGTYLE